MSGEIEFLFETRNDPLTIQCLLVKNPSISMIPPGVGITRSVGEIFCMPSNPPCAKQGNKVTKSNMDLVTSEIFYKDVIIMKEASS